LSFSPSVSYRQHPSEVHARAAYVTNNLTGGQDSALTYPPKLQKRPFFPNHRGDYYSKTALDLWFHEFWDALPEASVTKGNTPRVHDFRHSYCVYRLNQWVREKANLNALYPYLSEFVGHSNFADTDYYLTLAEPFYPEFESRMRAVNNAILPEVPHAD
jgi:integrase